MNAKHSAILLSGLLLLMIGIAWAQNSNPARPTCPADGDNGKWFPGSNTSKWVRADWNANTEVWDIDCSEAPSLLDMAPSNSAVTTANALPSRGRRRSGGNSNYVNMNPYKAPPDANVYINGMAYPGANIVPNVLPGDQANTMANVAANMSAANAINSTPRKRTRP